MKQTVRFELQMNAATKVKLDSLAKASGRTRSAAVRTLIEGAALKEMPPLEYHTLIAELRRIGGNLNQIAHIANSTGQINAAAYMKEAAELRRAVLAIRTAVELR